MKNIEQAKISLCAMCKNYQMFEKHLCFNLTLEHAKKIVRLRF